MGMVINPFVFYTSGPGIAYSETLDSNQGGYSAFNVRNIIGNAVLLKSGDEIRATIEAGSTEGLNLDSVYIGHKATSGNLYDFDGNQVELLFSGTSGVSISTGSESTSDYATFSYDNTKDIVVSIGVSTGTNDTFRSKNNPTSAAVRYASNSSSKAGDTTPSGTYFDASVLFGVSKIEVK